VLAAAIVALDPLTFYYSVLLLTETLFTFLALVFLWLLVEAGTKSRGPAFWLLAGAALGAATLTRPVIQAFFLFCLFTTFKHKFYSSPFALDLLRDAIINAVVHADAAQRGAPLCQYVCIDILPEPGLSF